MEQILDYRNFFFENNADIGRTYWGKAAAGCIFISKDTGRILLAHRSDRVDFEPNTWGTWGGKIDMDETPVQAVEREVEEETGWDGLYKVSPLYTYKDGEFKYYNFLIVIPFEFFPKLNWENDDSSWVEFGEWPSPLHFGMEALIQNAGSKIKNVIDLIKKRKPKTSLHEMDVPPAIHQSANDISSKLIQYVMKVENGGRIGRDKTGIWKMYKDNGVLHIGYGHKVQSGEEKTFASGLSDLDIKKLLIDDLTIAKGKIYPDIKHMFGVQIPLDQDQLDMLTDYAFNLGTLRGFPKFVKAVLNKDWDTAKKESIRNYKSKDGVSHPMGRNKDFSDTFLNKSQVNEDQDGISISKKGLVDDGVFGFEMRTPTTYLEYNYEPSRRVFYLEKIVTPKEEDRNKGNAKFLLEKFIQSVKKAGGTMDAGSFTTSGSAYIEHVVKRLAQQYHVRLI